MKFTLFLFVLLPLAYCASIEEKRFIYPTSYIYAIPPDPMSNMKALLGSDSTEAACEQECAHLVGIAQQSLCPMICRSPDMLVQDHFGQPNLKIDGDRDGIVTHWGGCEVRTNKLFHSWEDLVDREDDLVL